MKGKWAETNFDKTTANEQYFLEVVTEEYYSCADI